MVRKAALLFSCLLLSGCFVFDELDQGQKIMEQNGPAKPAAAPAPQAPAAQGGAGWWANAKSLSGPVSDSGNDPAVACRFGKSTRFMRKSDCLSQGGQPGK